MEKDRQKELEALAARLRRRVIDTVWRAQAGHPGGSLSAAEIMATLFFQAMRLDPARKLALLDRAIDALTTRYEVLSLGEHARRLRADPGLAAYSPTQLRI